VQAADNPQLFAFSRMTREAEDVVLVVVNLDPWNVQSGYLQLDLAELGLPIDGPYQAVDEVTGETYDWAGPSPWVRLDPAVSAGHILALRPPGS
jgi:starch synthase (maltosyl-transferring)